MFNIKKYFSIIIFNIKEVNINIIVTLLYLKVFINIIKVNRLKLIFENI